jgi:long-chain acyl-CoA synthetase
VLGVSDASDYAGAEKLHAVVVPDFDYLREQRLVNSKEAIRDEIERLSAQLPMHKRLLTYEIQAQPLPRTATKKLMRWLVKEKCASHPLAGDAGKERLYGCLEGDDLLLETECARQVLDVIKRESRIESTLHPDMNLELDLGFDSLRRIELIANIEQVLDVHLDDSVISQCFTIRDLLKQVAHQRNKGQSHLRGTAGTMRVTWKELLASASPEDMAQNYAVRPRPIISVMNFLLLKLVLVVSKMLFRLEVKGLDNLPRQGPYLICPNHQGYLDGVLVASLLPYSVVKDLFSLGWSPYYTTGIRRVLAEMIKTLPIDPDSNLLHAMKISGHGLKAGKILLMFPEGGMSSDGTLQTIKKGAAILAKELNIPILPVAIEGTLEVWSRVSNGLRIAPVKITIGVPLSLNAPEQPAGDPESGYAQDASRIQRELQSLLAAK